MILRSPVAHARIAELDLAPARAHARRRRGGLAAADDRMVRYVGAPIAAVAATDRKTALEALAAIRSSANDLPAVIGLDAARKADAPIVFDKAEPQAGRQCLGGRPAGRPLEAAMCAARPRCSRSRRGKREQLDRRGAQGAQSAAGRSHFPRRTQSHACLEPHAAVARFDGDRLTVHVSTQACSPSDGEDRQALQAPAHKVHVIADHVGGGFGSKASLGIETIAAIELARAAKAPVRVAFDRQEELSVTGYRPAAELKLALLPVARGPLKALSLTAHADTGAATNSTSRRWRA